MDELVDLQPNTVEKMINDNSVVMIDVRRKEEWIHTGVIKNAHKMTFFDAYGNHNIPKWMKTFSSIVPTKDTTIILICAHAHRTRLIGNYLIDQGYTHTAHLIGGMAQWIHEGKETIKHEA